MITFAPANKNDVLRLIPCAAIIPCFLKSKILKATKSNILKKSLWFYYVKSKRSKSS